MVGFRDGGGAKGLHRVNFVEDQETLAFREGVRTFVRQNLPDDIRDRVLNLLRVEKADFTRWQRILEAKGWGAPAWPEAFGGAGWTALQRKIFDEECFAAGAPRQVPHINMVGPILQAYGTTEQQKRFLPPLLKLDEWWCQGYSEPGAGSDLASLKTRAERKGEVYVLNGQKTWTTYAQWADWMFLLVRTDMDVKPQQGISFLLLDMQSPGVVVRPIISLDGGHDVNEVFLDNVEVPVGNLVGRENDGWTIAKYLLSFERTDIAAVGLCKRLLRLVHQIAGSEIKNGRPLIADPLLRDRVARLEMDLLAHEWTVVRMMSAADRGEPIGAETSILKVRSTEIQQQLTELLMDCAGPHALPYLPDARDAQWQGDLPTTRLLNGLAANYLDWRKVTIFGGSTEVQKNIISKALIGL
jgi:alkylation response protein AidB-like acyl-CoA dehydrogenase